MYRERLHGRTHRSPLDPEGEPVCLNQLNINYKKTIQTKKSELMRY